MNLSLEQDLLFAQFVADHNGGEAEDYSDIADTTRDEFDSFDGRNFAEYKGRTFETIDGFRAVHFDSAQAYKGQPRVSLWVVDFGDFRAVYQM